MCGCVRALYNGGGALRTVGRVVTGCGGSSPIVNVLRNIVEAGHLAGQVTGCVRTPPQMAGRKRQRNAPQREQ